MILQRVDAVDTLFREEGALLLYARELVSLSPLGEEIYLAAGHPVAVEDLAAHLRDVFGAPDGADLLDATRAAVTDLIARGVLREAPAAPSTAPTTPDEGTIVPEQLCVRVPRILLPAAAVDHTRWAVIACDQFTSQPEYWDEVERLVGDAPSTLRMVLPELHLNSPDVDERITRCQSSMRDYLAAGLLEPHQSLVYVEREVSGGLQRGLMVELDLEAYDFTGDLPTLVRATEGTVLDRLPPRMAVRRGAALELPHIMVLYDDPGQSVLANVLAARAGLPVAYDVELMAGSGHLTGRLVTDPALQEATLSALGALVEPDAYRARYGLDADHPLLFAMGDGNHSLATAKAVWEELKAAGAASDHPGRYALVELVNLHDASLSFEPIHRVVFGAEGVVEAVVEGVHARLTPVADMAALVAAVEEPGSQRFGIVTAGGHVLAEVPEPTHQLAVGTLQEHLDRWLQDHPEADVDYVHGEDVTDALASQPGNAGFVLPGIGKDAFFRSVAVDGPMPRKTFSMGHARDKRFYLECRAIVPGVPDAHPTVLPQAVATVRGPV